MFDKILVAIDGSPASEKALAVAVDLAVHYRAELLAIGVAEVPEVVGMMDEVDELRRARRLTSARSARRRWSSLGAGVSACVPSWFVAMPRTPSFGSPRAKE